MRSTKRAHGDVILDVRTALWLARRVSRMRSGQVPWRSRSRSRLRRLRRGSG